MGKNKGEVMSNKQSQTSNIGNLCLTLSVNDPIIIDNRIEISLIEVRNKREIRIGIKAPKSVNIVRLKTLLKNLTPIEK